MIEEQTNEEAYSDGNKLQEIEDFSYRYLELADIALIVGIAVNEFTDDSKYLRAFKVGRLKRKAKFNENIIKLTDQLSSPSMAIEQKMAEQAKINDSTL
jgi:hypothetical protein